MMFEGYFSMGGVEIINQHRVATLVANSECDPSWIRCKPCDGLADAIGEGISLTEPMTAPWWDEDDPTSRRFYGLYPVSVSGLPDSTREATVTEGILDGGVVQGSRRAVRRVTIRAVMIAEGEDALDYGLSWLDSALDPQSCSTHTGCGEVDACWFAACPPEWPLYDTGYPIPEAEYDALVDPLWRRMHGVVAISGPLIERKMRRGDWWAYVVEFTIAATTPSIYGVQVTLPTSIAEGSVVADAPVNLIPYPSAELPYGNSIVVATNYATNPSLETNATGWSPAYGSSNLFTPTPTGARSSELSAVGTYGYKVSVTTTNSGTAGSLYAVYDVTLPTYVVGQRFSISEWMAGFVVAGTAVINQTRLKVEWRTASAMVETITVGTGDPGGGAISGTSYLRPATATILRLVAALDLTSWSVGAQLAFYVDALAVTNP